MSRNTAPILVLAAGALLAQQTGESPEVRQIFAGPLTLQRPTPSTVNVGVHLATIRGGARIPTLTLPGRGVWICQVRTGTLTSIIGSTRQARKEGEFWTVPAGASMGIETENDTAILQVVVIRE